MIVGNINIIFLGGGGGLLACGSIPMWLTSNYVDEFHRIFLPVFQPEVINKCIIMYEPKYALLCCHVNY